MRVPGLIDIVTVRDPAALRAMAADPRLDRPQTGRGPLLNRLITRLARDTLKADNHLLPSGRTHGDHRRHDLHAALSARLSAPGLEAALDGPVRDAAVYVAGGAGDPLRLAQGLLGPVLIDGFTPSDDTVAAAATIGRPLSGGTGQQVLDWLTGRSRRARKLLYGAANGDLNAVHAIGIASQNLAASLDAMRAAGLATPAAKMLAHAMIAPKRVLRQGTAPAETLGGSVRAGTLVLLSVEDATRRTLDPRVAFLRDAWSGCPAHGFVPALLRRIWAEAGGAS
ncbi:hypothetical protein HC022_20435 [Salipiger sp. HF18]|uniref:hypothetical protein n=1 Tax=Salipiger sp. HF18 TaxID=2721557 RepID=UPI00142E4ABC|nr:hypothetical protein [Salipiger sp. HF18]NIY98504.1 hypothetical protein [Salipiger sp. HF18]